MHFIYLFVFFFLSLLSQLCVSTIWVALSSQPRQRENNKFCLFSYNVGIGVELNWSIKALPATNSVSFELIILKCVLSRKCMSIVLQKIRQLVRAVKEKDLKSFGLCPRRFESCSCRYIFWTLAPPIFFLNFPFNICLSL